MNRRRLFDSGLRNWSSARSPTNVIRAIANIVRRCVLERSFGPLALAARSVLAGNPVSVSYETWIRMNERDAFADYGCAEGTVAGTAAQVRLSVIITPAGRPLELVSGALLSLVEQSHGGLEVFILLDESGELAGRQLQEQASGTDLKINLLFFGKRLSEEDAINVAIEKNTAEFLCFCDYGTRLSAEALCIISRNLFEHPDADFLYADEDQASADGHQRFAPFFKPDWSPEYMECYMYTGRFGCFRAERLGLVGGVRGGFGPAWYYDLVLRFVEHAGKVLHVPRILSHHVADAGIDPGNCERTQGLRSGSVRALQERLQRSGQDGFVFSAGEGTDTFGIRYRPAGTPRVSIVIPTAGKDRVIWGSTVNLLTNCVQSIYEKSSYENFEIVVVHDDELDPDIRDSLGDRRIRFINANLSDVNVARKMNIGAGAALGEYLVFLNDDIEVISPHWMEAMISIAQKEQVGVVGAKLRYADGTLQHVGVSFWNGLPNHVLRGFPAESQGYFHSAVVDRNYLAVTGACMMLGRGLFSTVGGFDEGFAMNYNDIDLCLRIWKRGFRNAYSAHAELYHFESLSRDQYVPASEQIRFLKRWQEQIYPDPFYSKEFQGLPLDFTIRQ